MVARNYSKHRSELAKDMGLGKPIRASQQEKAFEESPPIDTQVLISRAKRRSPVKQESGR